MSLLIPAAAAIILLGAPGVSFAQAPERATTPFRLGAMDIFPGFSASVAYDDNIFQTQRNEESDTIIHYTPSLGVNLPFAAASSASARVELDIQDYSDNNSEDTDNITVDGGLNLERIVGRYYSRTAGKWKDTDESASSEEQSAIGSGQERTNFSFGTAAGFGGYENDKSRLEVNGGYFESRFDRAVDKRLNEEIWRLGALGEYRISPKTSVRLEYGFRRNEFNDRLPTDQRDDSDSHFVRAGLSFSSGALITGHATVGAEFIKYDKTITPASTQDRDTSGLSADVDLTWKVRPERTELRGRFASTIESASTAGQFGFRSFIGEIGLSQGLFFISRFLKADVAYSHEKDDFLRSSRRDTINSLRATLTYARQIANMPWVASLDYTYSQRDSNVSGNDYENNVIMFNLGVQY